MVPLAYSIQALSAATSISRSSIYEAIASGALVARHQGRRTLITHAAAVAWLDGMPVVAASGMVAGGQN